MSCFCMGSTFTIEALSPTFQSKLSIICTLISRLKVLFAHDALYLFPNSCICCGLLLPGGSRVIYRVLMRPFLLVFKKYVISTLIRPFGLSPFFQLLAKLGWGFVVQWIYVYLTFCLYDHIMALLIWWHHFFPLLMLQATISCCWRLSIDGLLNFLSHLKISNIFSINEMNYSYFMNNNIPHF